jgi:hypothetical protein
LQYTCSGEGLDFQIEQRSSRVAVPPDGFGQRYSQITDWLDENCGTDGWAMTPSGMRGVLNDAVSIYSRRHPRECLRCAVVRRLQGRGGGGRLQGAGRRAGDENCGEHAPDTMIQEITLN